MQANMNATAYLTSVLAPLLNFPADLKIVCTQDQRGVLLSVDVHKDDMGIVIGKAGETAKSVRHLVKIVGFKENANVSVKINEPEGSLYNIKT